MRKLKAIALLLAFTSSISILYAQSVITFGGTHAYSTFNFTDSEGTILNSEYDGVLKGSYTLSYHYITSFGLKMHAGVGISNTGAILDYDTLCYSWDLQYARGILGVGYIYKNEFVSPYLNVSGYYGFMLSGRQIIYNEHNNILKSGAINQSDYGFIISPGVQFNFTNSAAVFIELDYLMGLANLEPDGFQESKNISYGASVGFAFTIGK